jgi:lactate racemase
MAEIELRYGKASFGFEYAEERFHALAPENEESAQPLSDAEIGVIIDDPLDSQSLEEIISPGESVLIVVSDATRASASAQVVNVIVRRLVQLGVAPSDIRIIFATGIHRAVTADEKTNLLSSFITSRIKILDHNSLDSSQLANLGATERGTPIEINRALLEHSHVILTGAINFHYFAGFTGGRKSICPGLASARTIQATHLHALDFERGGRRAGVGSGRLDGNLVHEECERIAAEVAPSFLVNVVADEHNCALKVYAGDWRVAHRRGCAEYANEHVLPVAEKRRIVIASCGGSPHDINMIQAHKALDMAAHACEEEGAIILLAECADGLGRADFLKWFTEASDSCALENILRECYEVNGQTAWALLTKAERFRIYLVSSLPENDVRRMRMIPVRSIDEALGEISDNTSSGYILPHGAMYMPVVKSDL